MLYCITRSYQEGMQTEEESSNVVYLSLSCQNAKINASLLAGDSMKSVHTM